MNQYEQMLRLTLDMIEECESAIPLQEIAQFHHMSPYHFERIFTAGIGISYNQYVLARRLTKAADMLLASDATIIQVALEHGFDYAEVFSRAFKRYFGMAPKHFRTSPGAASHPARMEKATPMFRPLINHKGGLTIRPQIRHFNSMRLAGSTMPIRKDDPNFNRLLMDFCKDFMDRTKNEVALEQGNFYNVVECLGDGVNFNFFIAKSVTDEISPFGDLRLLEIPEGQFATITYGGRMSEVRPTFEDDLYKWLMVRGMEIRPAGFSMLVIYGAGYPDDAEVTIRIPIK